MNVLSKYKIPCISFISLAGTCQILNGGCEEICIPVVHGRRCECDVGLQLQDDFTCDSSMSKILMFIQRSNQSFHSFFNETIHFNYIIYRCSDGGIYCYS